MPVCSVPCTFLHTGAKGRFTDSEGTRGAARLAHLLIFSQEPRPGCCHTAGQRQHRVNCTASGNLPAPEHPACRRRERAELPLGDSLPKCNIPESLSSSRSLPRTASCIFKQHHGKPESLPSEFMYFNFMSTVLLGLMRKKAEN